MTTKLVFLTIAALLAVVAAQQSNPFVGADLFVDPDYFNEVCPSRSHFFKH
jgi:hypothetical protein